MKKTCCLVTILLMVLMLVLMACTAKGSWSREENLMLKDIAYGNPECYANIIYILENEQYAPYLVFPSNYDRNLLLLRYELTDESIAYNDTNVFNAEGNYYPDSNIDKHLNEIFIARFTPALQDTMEISNVEITALETINRESYLRKTEYISRKIFLLSATEVGIKNGMTAVEGQKVKGLENFSTEDSQWLRTAYLWDDVHAWSYSIESAGQEPVSSALRLRPAFVLSPELAITTRNDVDQDMPEFVLEIDK